MKCPKCQAESRAGVSFCEDCGTRLGIACPRCGAGVLPDKTFCGFCGVSLAAPSADRFTSPEAYTPRHLAEKILTSRAALEGERKQVTVLFADLKGSMELLADRDPEEARKLLDPVLEMMMVAVHLYEGTVNQVMGDGIMALFGAPVAHEDHAVRACFAAVKMQEAVNRYAEEIQRSHGVVVQIRVGLNSGEVVVRSVGSDLRMDYSAVGQTTHLAARMEQMARPGSVLAAPSTLQLAEGYVQVKPLGPVPVKGLEAPLDVYEVVGVGPIRSRMHAAAARGLTPFVGRADEMDQLRQALGRAVAGHGQVVALVGEPGVGKTRLLWEFAHSHRTHGCLLIETGAVSYGKATAHLPVIDLLRAYAGIEPRDDARRIREKFTGKILTLDESLAPTLPAFLSLLDVLVEDPKWEALDPAQRRQRTLDACKRLLLRESQVQPVVLLFEHLQWIDSETQAFLDGLIESLQAAQLLLLVSYRPEYQHGWGNKAYYTQLRLGSLPQETAEELLQALLGPDPQLQPLKLLLIDRTDRNPFFLEESVRTLVETQVLVGERGAYRLAKALSSIRVPASVQAVLAARIDRLPSEEKRLLQSASVIGKDVPLTLLSAITDLPEDELRRGLTNLQAAEFLFETSLFPEIEYTFRHSLTHDVVYGGILQERRRTLHSRILATIERLSPDRLGEQVDRLAHHAFRGEAWEKAVIYYRQAGAKAAARSANREAVACFEQALGAIARLPESRETMEQAIDLRFDLRPPLLQLGRLQDALALSQDAERMAQLIGDQQRVARVYSYFVNYHYLKGEPDLAIEYGERCLAVAAASEDLALQALARGYMGYSYHAQGRYRHAELILEQNIEALEAAPGGGEAPDRSVPYITSNGWLAFTLAELGDFELARTYLDKAHTAAQASGHAWGQTIAGTLSGLVALRHGRVERAVAELQSSLEACREKNLALWQPIPSSLLGLALVLLGRPDEALPLLQDGITLSEEVGVNAYLALWTSHLGEGLLAAGELDRALTIARHAFDLARAHQERGHEAWALRLLGEIAARRSPPEVESARECYDEAMRMASELGMRPLLARCHLGLGQLYARLGNRAGAQEHLIAALATLRSLDMGFWLDQVEVELAGLGKLFIVAREHSDLYEYLKRAVAGSGGIQVIMDRRRSDRRQRAQGHRPERRQSERRHPSEVSDQLRSRGLAIVGEPLEALSA